ncbi:hypothetical protein Tco_0059269 [Tanacetum coccineum]
MESVKKSIDKRALHKREYDIWVNERQMQTTEENVDTSNALEASLVDIESSRTESKEQDTSKRSGNDAHADDAEIRPIYDEEPMAEVQTTTEINVFATGKQHTEQPEFNNEGEEHKVAKLLKENETLKRHYKELFDYIKTTRAKTIKHTTSLIAKNDEFKAQLQEKGFAIAALKNENQLVVRQPTAFKSERPRISKPRFASQVDVNNDLSKPVTTYYLRKERESAIVKPHHVIASSESRNSSKTMSRFSSNDMVHNHYLEEAKKKTQESGRNSRPSVMPSARSQSTTNGSKPKPRINNQKSRNWPATKSSCVELDLVKPTKKKVQIMIDEEIVLKLQAKIDEEERIAIAEKEKIDEANIAWDDIQEKVDVDYQLAERLQAEEQEQFTIEEKDTLFKELLEQRRKHLAAKRAEEKRNKPPTKTQQKKTMIT